LSFFPRRQRQLDEIAAAGAAYRSALAGLWRITLHGSRHTTLTLMEYTGVPISIISKWA
jgi:integrase